ncbi:hypothetical protein [Glutamicibacter sp. AOP3-A1-12]|uniref:hypothetical protein n=1 Tax=Glutamicibacter sp. AOP3-A1-12 TaxID=3457701 RepID=UPI004033CA93
MSNQPPLNPDALEVACDAVIDASFGQELPEAPIDLATAAVSAYLAVAQPEVNSVEELDALPFNTVAAFTMFPLDRPVPFELSSINGTDKTWQQPGDGAAYPNSIMARYLPARVLYRPEVKP